MCSSGLPTLQATNLQVLEERYPQFDANLQADFQQLLSFPDQTLQRWLLGDGAEVETGMERIVQAITDRDGMYADQR